MSTNSDKDLVGIDPLDEDLDRDEERLWAQASSDPDFRAEMRALPAAYQHAEAWPEVSV
ncbi:hypothetical protein BH23CHL8_BH23CHL8_03350 [soil metagenome]